MTATNSREQVGGESEVLVIYGVPPAMDLMDARRRKVGRFELTRTNQGSFAVALRRALGTFLGDHVSLANAELVFVRDADAFRMAVKNAHAKRLIYYGHALAESNTLLPSLGNSINAWQLFNSLKDSSIVDFDILGCSGSSIAAELSTMIPRLRVGYLRFARQDNIEAEPTTSRIINMRIDPQALHHFGPRNK